jgi:exoribonuclease-2
MFKNNAVLMQLKGGLTAQVTTVSQNRVTGTVRGARNGFGFLACEDGSSHFIPPPQMNRCLPGDIVEAQVVSNQKGDGKTECVIEKIIESSCTTFIGVVRKKGHNPYITPESLSFNNDFLIPRLKRDKEREGDYVIAKILKHPFEDGGCHAEIQETICGARDRQAFWKVASARHNLKHEAPAFDHDEVAALNLAEADDTQGFDWRNECLVTIDGDNCRDMDDAVGAKYVQTESGTDIVLVVAIADPDRFITEGGNMDMEARSRCFTTYFPGLTIPMLSKVISEQGASLVEGEDRMSLCCSMNINKMGEITDSFFFRAVINSKAKLSYDGVQAFLDGKPTEYSEPVKEVLAALDEARRRRNLWRVSNALVSRRYTDKTFVVEGFELKSIERTENNQAQRIIEECMISANLSFGQYMHSQGVPCIYRRHSGFKAEKLDQVVALLSHHGIDTSAVELATAKGYARVMRLILGRDNQPLEQILIGYHDKSWHSTEYGDHFAMGLEGYATFTSPIRKYCDLINHRFLKALLRGEASTVQPISEDLLALMDEKAVTTERASRDVQNDLYAQMYSTMIGSTHAAKITGVMAAGARAEILDTGASVFMATRSLGKKSDFFEVSQDGLTLLKNGRGLFQVGQDVNVVIGFVDIPGRSLSGSVASTEIQQQEG